MAHAWGGWKDVTSRELEEIAGFYLLEEVPELARADGKLRGRSLITITGAERALE